MLFSSRSSRQRRRSSMWPAALFVLGIVASHDVKAGESAASPSLASNKRFMSNDGAFLYSAICQGCHMADAKGATGGATFPALAENPRLASRLYPALMVVRGRGGMPPLAADLDDEQIAAVVNYLRSHYGNHYTDPLTAAEVKALRR
jgi:mono/diheme cytochrome c family protein